MLGFHLQEIDAAALVEGEEEHLTERKAFFDNAGRLVQTLDTAFHALDGEEGYAAGACEQLAEAAGALGSLADVSGALRALSDKAEELKYLAQDLRGAVADLRSRTDFSAEEQAAVEERLDLIYRLKLKYGGSIPEILAYAQKARDELDTLQAADQTREALLQEYRRVRQTVREQARGLSAKRRESAAQLEKRIVDELADLDLSKVRFAVRVETGSKLGPKGLDTASFLISVNPGEPLQGISKVASGGELSRIMLAMKNVLTAREPVGTLIFDEIDTGVSGRAAQKIAHKLCEIGDKKQTLCVTHLPQIAAIGRHHLLITKRTDGDRTYTQVRPVAGEERVEEIARMISGDRITDISRKNALELLQSSEKQRNPE